MSKLRDVKTLQKFASMQASIDNHFNPERHLSPHETFKQNRAAAMAEWLQLAARYSHNFDIRRLVRIRLMVWTAPPERHHDVPYWCCLKPTVGRSPPHDDYNTRD